MISLFRPLSLPLRLQAWRSSDCLFSFCHSSALLFIFDFSSNQIICRFFVLSHHL
nr:MAG TPA: hypothetical protein [Caudoviricetes sp.]